MKKRFLSLFLILILLCGCAAEPSDSSSGNGNRFSSASEAATLTYLRHGDYLGLAAMGDNLVLLGQNSENQAVLTLLSGTSLKALASVSLPQITYPTMELFQVRENSITCCDPDQNQLLILGEDLETLRTVDLPGDIAGNALVSRDLSTLYFGTAHGVCSMDLETGTRQVLLDEFSPYKHMNCLLDGDRILNCTLSSDTWGQAFFLDTESGEVLARDPELHQVWKQGDRYYASLMEPTGQTLFFGTVGQRPQSLLTRADSLGTFLPDSRRAVCWVGGEMPGYVILHCYDLDTGLCTSSLEMDVPFTPWSAAETADGQIWLLGQGAGSPLLVCWHPEKFPSVNSEFHLVPYYTARHPDTTGLARCQEYARSLSEKYGIEILVWRDVQQVLPWDYDFRSEHRVSVLRQELEILDRCLANYPDDMLARLSREINGLHLCLVRGIYGKEGRGGLPSVSGLQYTEADSCYMALVTQRQTEYTLYHELCHILDLYVIPRSHAYEAWESLNPPDFSYDNDYLKNLSRDGQQYLQNGTRAFVDTYSMSFPEEDRARIMEYAMTRGHDAMFDSPVMQAKLKTLSRGIREAFGMTEDPRTFLWEHYIHKPEPQE